MKKKKKNIPTTITTVDQMIQALLTSPNGGAILAEATRLCNEYAATPNTDPTETVTLTRLELNSLILITLIGGRVIYERITPNLVN